MLSNRHTDPTTVTLAHARRGLMTDRPTRCNPRCTCAPRVNEGGCRDGTMPKTVETRRHCEVGVRACNSLLQHALDQSSSQCLLVSTVFGMVPSIHSTSFFVLVSLLFDEI